MNDEALLEVPPLPEQAFAPLGEVLVAARKAKKLSAQDVSNNLRLSLKQISDIENNDFSTLPQPMITRGFIRNYARLLEIDAEPLLDSYRARVPDTAPKSMSVQSSMHQVVSGKESQPWLKYILGSILILLFLLAWIFYIDYMPKPVKSPAGKPLEAAVATQPTTDLALPEIALPAAERQAEPSEVVTGTDNTTTTAVTLPAETKNDTHNPPVTNVPTTSAATPNATAPITTAPNVTTLNATTSTGSATTQAAKPADSIKPATTKPAGTASSNPAPASQSENSNTSSQKVSVNITEKTWIQATDKSGKVIYERILPAGSSDGFDGQPPFIVVIGNAKATKLSFLGKPVDLTPNTTQNNVARIKLE